MPDNSALTIDNFFEAAGADLLPSSPGASSVPAGLEQAAHVPPSGAPSPGLERATQLPSPARLPRPPLRLLRVLRLD
jgi:hypothetical protein